MGLPIVPTSLVFYSKAAADYNCPLPTQIKNAGTAYHA